MKVRTESGAHTNIMNAIDVSQASCRIFFVTSSPCTAAVDTITQNFSPKEQQQNIDMLLSYQLEMEPVSTVWLTE